MNIQDENEIFDGKTAADIYKEVYDFAVEERVVALAMFNKLNKYITEKEDGFMQGDKPAPYLDSAHKATENIIKLLQVINKMKGDGSEKDAGLDVSALIEFLDEKDIAPERMRVQKEEKETKNKNKVEDIFSKPLMIKKEGETDD